MGIARSGVPPTQFYHVTMLACRRKIGQILSVKSYWGPSCLRVALERSPKGSSRSTAAPALLDELKAKGYRVVHMQPKNPVTTIAQWDDVAKSEIKGLAQDRPTSSVVRTIDSAPPSTAAVKTVPTK